jgi:hypothetical protein
MKTPSPRASVLTLLVSLVAASCTSIVGDFDASTTAADGSVDGSVGRGDASGGTETSADAGKALGVACSADGECAMGHCADGVCCESACKGTCETCNAAGAPGMCVPIPAGTDPELECVSMPVPVPEAGTVDAGAGEAGDASSGDASDAASVSDAGIVDAAFDVGFNVPDGGVASDDTKCVGSCNGQRACSYPSRTKICGTQFCNTSAQSGAFACDGTGHCALDLEPCTNYACVGRTCGTTCSQVTDCLPTAFCNSSGMCQPQHGNGIGCTLDNQCSSGHCVQSVCCSDACNVPGGTCTSSGAIGECKCSVSCGDGGTCQLFYRDADGDTYGDKLGTIANGNAAVGCSGAPPSGFVANNTDCDDHDSNANPAQTNYFGTPSLGVGTYDYNCDGTLEKQTAEYPGSYCTFCGGTSPSCSTASTCASSGQYSTLTCATRYVLCGGFPIIRFCPICGGTTAGFTSTVNCGATANYTTCSTCTAAGGYTQGATISSVQQKCH